MSGKYPENWGEIAAKKKCDVSWKCERCGHEHDAESGYVLTVHHLDMDKSNVEWWNLVALCQRCHLKVQARVKMDQGYLFGHAEWFQQYIDGRSEAMKFEKL